MWDGALLSYWKDGVLKYVCGERQQRPDTTVSGGCGLVGAPEPRCWIDEQGPGW